MSISVLSFLSFLLFCGEFRRTNCLDESAFGCPAGSTVAPPLGRCFWHKQVILTQEEGAKSCDAEGGTLAVDDSPEAHAEIFNIRIGNKNSWLGLRDVLPDNDLDREWRWPDATPLAPWAPWRPGQPNGRDAANPGATVQDCLVLDSTGKWQDKNCSEPDCQVICQKKISVLLVFRYGNYSVALSDLSDGLHSTSRDFGYGVTEHFFLVPTVTFSRLVVGVTGSGITCVSWSLLPVGTLTMRMPLDDVRARSDRGAGTSRICSLDDAVGSTTCRFTCTCHLPAAACSSVVAEILVSATSGRISDFVVHELVT